MMNSDFDLANESRSAFATFEEATHYLEDVCARMKVNHLSYWLVHSIDGTPDQVTWITTYDPSYMSFYMANYTPLGDSSFETAIAENQVLDWADDDSTKSRSAAHRAEIRDHQVRHFRSPSGMANSAMCCFR